MSNRCQTIKRTNNGLVNRRIYASLAGVNFWNIDLYIRILTSYPYQVAEET